MLQLIRFGTHGSPTNATLVLPYDIRQKSRFRAVLDDGREAAVLLPRRSILRDGDVVEGDATRVLVRAALESVSVASSPDRLLLARAAYHMGNRHVPLQIKTHCIVYQRDHVLDRMLGDLGLSVTTAILPFDPETGAYGHSSIHSHAAHDTHSHGDHEHCHHETEP